MTHVITDPCVGTCDTACVEVCPVDCIHPIKSDNEAYFEDVTDKQLFINPDECIDCGACIAECPVEAIYAEEDLPDGQEHQLEKNAVWFAS